MDNEIKDNNKLNKQNLSPKSEEKSHTSRDELLARIKASAKNTRNSTSNLDTSKVQNTRNSTIAPHQNERTINSFNTASVQNTRGKTENTDISNVKNTRAQAIKEPNVEPINIKNTRSAKPEEKPTPTLSVKNTRAVEEKKDDIPSIMNTRSQATPAKEAKIPSIKNTRSATTSAQPSTPEVNIQNTRATQKPVAEVNIVNTRAQKPEKPIRHHSETKQFEVPENDQTQFIDLVNKTLQSQNKNQTIFNMADFDLPQIDFSAFGLPDLSSNIELPKQHVELPPQEEIDKALQTKIPTIDVSKLNKIPVYDESAIKQAELPFADSDEQEQLEQPIVTTTEHEEVQTEVPTTAEEFEEITEQKTPTESIKRPPLPPRKPPYPFGSKPTPQKAPPKPVVSVEEIEEPEIPAIVEEIEEPAIIQSKQELPSAPTPKVAPEQEPQKPVSKDASIDDLFGIDTTAKKTYIPESEQKDILALVDIALNNNVADVLASQKVEDVAVMIDGTAEDLVVTKVRHGRNLWILMLLFLVGITALFACCYDSWFGRRINEEEASGLTLNIVPSSGSEGSVDAQYIFFPGSTIIFKDGVNIGSERYRYEEQPDGSLKQYENNAFSFRFRFYVEFVDEGSEGARPEHNEIISHVIEPEDMDAMFKVAPDDSGEETINPYSYDGSWIYYFGVIIPGEKYITFCEGISIYQSIPNTYQGKSFVIIMEYETVVPDETVMEVFEDMPDAPLSWASQITSEYKAYYENH